MIERNIGLVPPAFIVPGVDKEYPQSGLHVKATQQYIKIFPEGQPRSDYWAETQVSYGGSMKANLKIRDATIFHRRKIAVFGAEFIRFALEYFDTYANSPPSEFLSMWLPNKSDNMSAFTKAMKGKPDTEGERVAAAAKTWTAHALKDHFIPRSATWSYNRSYLSVWFSRR